MAKKVQKTYLLINKKSSHAFQIKTWCLDTPIIEYRPGEKLDASKFGKTL